VVETPFPVSETDRSKLIADLESPSMDPAYVHYIVKAVFHLATQGPRPDNSSLHFERSQLLILHVLNPIKPGVKPAGERPIIWTSELVGVVLGSKDILRNRGPLQSIICAGGLRVEHMNPAQQSDRRVPDAIIRELARGQRKLNPLV
jgi:hypothetical protein